MTTPLQTSADIVYVPHGTPNSQSSVQPYQLEPFNLVDSPALPRRQWIIWGALIRRYVTMWLAPGGVGKSSYSFPLAMGLAAGRDVLGLGLAVEDPIRVWIANLEDDQTELNRRAIAAAKHHDISLDELGDRLFLTSGRQQPIKITNPDGSISAQEVLKMKDVIDAKNLDVLVIDPFVHSHHAPENDNGAMAAVMEAWSEIADNTNTAIILVHHVRKGGGEVTTESTRGASSLTGAARVALTFNRMTDDEAGEWGVENPRQFFRTYADKGNLAPAPEKSDWFRLHNVPLQNGDEVGVVGRWHPPKLFDRVPSDAPDRVTRVLASTPRNRTSDQSPEWFGYDVAELFELDPDGDRRKIKKMLQQWLKNEVIVKAKAPDANGIERPIFKAK